MIARIAATLLVALPLAPAAWGAEPPAPATLAQYLDRHGYRSADAVSRRFASDMVTPIRMGDAAAVALIDSGAARNLVVSPHWEELANRRAIDPIETSGKPHGGLVLRVGGEDYYARAGRITEDEVTALNDYSPRVSCILGLPFLRQSRAVLDYQAGQIHTLPERPEREGWVGEWDAVACRRDSGVTYLVGEGYALRADERTCTLQFPSRKDLRLMWQLDPGANPPGVTLTETGGPAGGSVFLGVYRLDAGRLELCMSLQRQPHTRRPTRLEPNQCNGDQVVLDFRRRGPAARQSPRLGLPPGGLRQRLQAEGYWASPLDVGPDSWLTVPARVGGQDVHLVVDTGATESSVGTAVAEKAKVPLGEAVPIGGSGFLGKSVRPSQWPNVEIGPIRTGPIALNVHDTKPLNFMRTRSSDKPASGIVGHDILRRHKAVIDFGAGVLYLKPLWKLPAAQEGDPSTPMAR